jgi:hypothetical protein
MAAPFTPKTRSVLVKQNIASGQITVPARNYMRYRIEVTPEMQDAHLTGSFTATGGSGNDIAVALANEDEFDNWINGHQAQVYYSTPGKETTGQFDVPLAPGTYVLGFNNRFALLSNKYVNVQVDLKYSRLETY